jgi:nitrate reductase (NAD(P)H)
VWELIVEAFLCGGEQTWCHWSLELEAWRLLKADEIGVRAVDAQLNTQPSDPTWNLLGMMNNCWYVSVSVDVDV